MRWGSTLSVLFLLLACAPTVASADIPLPPPPPLPGPIVTAVSLASSNASTTVAGPGDTVTLSFASDQAALILPSVSIGGHTAVVSAGAGNTWTASVLMRSTDTEGDIAFSAAVGNNSGSATTTVSGTTDGSSVFFDRTPPVVTLNGSSTVELTAGDTFTDPGATALDSHDGSASVSTSGSVDTSTAGTYTLTYTATDAAGNTSTNALTVTVDVAPAPAPVVSSGGGNGPPPLILTQPIGPQPIVSQPTSTLSGEEPIATTSPITSTTTPEVTSSSTVSTVQPARVVAGTTTDPIPHRKLPVPPRHQDAPIVVTSVGQSAAAGIAVGDISGSLWWLWLLLIIAALIITMWRRSREYRERRKRTN